MWALVGRWSPAGSRCTREGFLEEGAWNLGSTWKESQGWGAGAEIPAFAEGCRWEHRRGGQAEGMLSSCPPSGLLLQTLIKSPRPPCRGGDTSSKACSAGSISVSKACLCS